jgi:putative heme iron utilization protein
MGANGGASLSSSETTPERSRIASKPSASRGESGAKATGAPFAEPGADGSNPVSELSLPRQSENATSSTTPSSKKKGALTRLLRTPWSGGVLNSMKDADLPSVAVAARNLMELADYADLSTIMSDMNHRRSGYPVASTVDFATDADGYPVFCLTPLAMHTRNLAYNARASLTVKMNGWGGLANARVTIFGDVHRLPAEYQASANEIFKAKYAARKEASDLEDRWGDYTFYRMNNVIDVYFVGGFGTLNWVDLKEYRDAEPDKIVTPGAGHSVLDTLSELNTKYGPKLAKSGAVLGNSIAPNEAVGEAKAAFESVRVDDLWIISIDKMGIDVRVRLDGVSQVRRINFMGCVETFEDACEALDAIVAGEVWEGGNCDE